MLNKKAQLTKGIWEAVELMIAGALLVLIIWIGVLIYTSLIASPADAAKAENAFNILHTAVTDLAESKLPFDTTITPIQLPEGYVITFFYDNKNVDKCSYYLEGEDTRERIKDSLVKAHCEPPCMCLYKIKSKSYRFFEDNNDPDHKMCKTLPAKIDKIVTWYFPDLSMWYSKTENEVFMRNIRGAKVSIQGYPQYPAGPFYSEVFIYGTCRDKRGQIDFGKRPRQIYLDKTELKDGRTVIFLTGKTTMTDTRKDGFYQYLTIQ